MTKKLGLIDAILEGKKTIESRWYKTKRSPWNMISEGETVYFKDTGGPVRAKATVKTVLQFSNLDQNDIQRISEEYASQIMMKSDQLIQQHQTKKYCILVFLQDAQSVKPFHIDKTGFGNMTAWITVDDIKKIKMKSKSES